MAKKTCKIVTGNNISTSERIAQSKAIKMTADAYIAENPNIEFDALVDKVKAFWKDGSIEVTTETVTSSLEMFSPDSKKESIILAKKKIEKLGRQKKLIKDMNTSVGLYEQALSKDDNAATGVALSAVSRELSELVSIAEAMSLDTVSMMKITDLANEASNGLIEGNADSVLKAIGEIESELNIDESIKSLKDQIKSDDLHVYSSDRKVFGAKDISGAEKKLIKEEVAISKKITDKQQEINRIIEKERKKNRTKGQVAGEITIATIREAFNIPKATLLSGDFVATFGRQFGFFTFDPRFWVKNKATGGSAIYRGFVDGFLKSFREMDAHTVWKVHVRSEGFQDAVEHGLEQFSPVEEVTVGEEQYRSAVIDSKLAKAVGVKGFFDMSQRTYRAMLNSLTLDAYRVLNYGVTDPAIKRENAEKINSIVGRGTWAKRMLSSTQIIKGRDGKKMIDMSAIAVLTPRYTLSGLESLGRDIYSLRHLPKEVMEMRKGVATETIRGWATYIIAGQAINSLLVYAMGGEQDDDPESSTFGQVLMDDLYLNVWGSRYQPVRFVLQGAMGIYYNMFTDEGFKNNQDIWSHLQRRKSVIWQIMDAARKGENWGQPYPRLPEIYDQITMEDQQALIESMKQVVIPGLPIPIQTLFFQAEQANDPDMARLWMGIFEQVGWQTRLDK